MYSDRVKVPSEALITSTLQIQVELISESGRTERLPELVAGKGFQNYWIDEGDAGEDLKEHFINEISHEKYLEDGVLMFAFDTPNNTNKILIKALYTSEDGITVEAKLEAVQFFSPKRKFISVHSSSTNLKVDEYAVVHVKANFILDSFQYLVSK